MRMANETASASENADVNVEVMRNAAKSPSRRRAHGDRGRLADGHGHLDRGPQPASRFYHRLRPVGSRIGGLCCPRPFSIYQYHDCRTHFSFDVYHLHCPSSVCHYCRGRCHRDDFALCPAPSIFGGPGTRRVIHGLRCVCSQPRHPDDRDNCLYHRNYGMSCTNSVKENVVTLSKRKWLMMVTEEESRPSNKISRVQSVPYSSSSNTTLLSGIP